MNKTKIIVVEDNIVYCEYVCNMLSREGYQMCIRDSVNGKLYSPMVNIVRYADDFIITCENKETLENEINPLVD